MHEHVLKETNTITNTEMNNLVVTHVTYHLAPFMLLFAANIELLMCIFMYI